MRNVNTLSTVGATVIQLGDAEFISAGQTVYIAAGDSVATATLSVKFAGIEVGVGPVDIEPGTDRLEWPGSLFTYFTAMKGGQLTATAGGTVAGLRVKVLIAAPQEPRPW